VTSGCATDRHRHIDAAANTLRNNAVILDTIHADAEAAAFAGPPDPPVSPEPDVLVGFDILSSNSLNSFPDLYPIPQPE